jgi:uncharacterized membrane protein
MLEMLVTYFLAFTHSQLPYTIIFSLLLFVPLISIYGIIHFILLKYSETYKNLHKNYGYNLIKVNLLIIIFIGLLIYYYYKEKKYLKNQLIESDEKLNEMLKLIKQY